MVSIKRFKRIFNRLRSRYKDYSGLRAASSTSEAVRWFRLHDTRMFNGNVLRAKIIQGVVELAQCDVFVETGTSHAATAIGASRFLQIPVWSCENSPFDYWISRLITVGMRDLRLYKQDSRDFLRQVVPKIKQEGKTPIFYLDAHEGALDRHSLPLPDEIEIILTLETIVVVIDDFRIPHDDSFVFGTYGGVSIEMDLIYETLLKGGIPKCFFPAYASSEETGFVTGFCMFWRSKVLDRAIQKGGFPFNLIRAFNLQPRKTMLL